MNLTTQYHLSTRYRHFRYLFFVESSWSLDNLKKLIHTNLKLWGGRYNPIIPVYNNIISEEYLEVIKHYDPDFIGYTSNVNPEIIKNLNIFNPEKYFNLDNPHENRIQGVNASYLLEDQLNKEIAAQISYNQDGLDSFYLLNFNITKDTYAPKFVNNVGEAIALNPYLSICNYLVKRKPIFRSLLSTLNINTTILRDETLSSNQFELIISKENGAIEDYFYFWNRQLFVLNNNELKQLIVTEKELEVLLLDTSFGEMLYSFASNNNTNAILITSFSLPQEEIQNIIAIKLKPIYNYISFDYKKHEAFPFKILDAGGLYERNYGENILKQSFLSNNGLLHFPKLSFSNNVPSANKWVVDIEIEKIADHSRRVEKFPKHTEHQYFFKLKGRINKQNNISLFVDNTNQSLEFNVPSFNQRIHQLLRAPKINGQKVDTKFSDFGIGDSGAKLSSFIKLFDGNLPDIGAFLEDKFWFQIVYNLSSNTRTEGNAISFIELKSQCIIDMEKDGIKLDTETYQNEINLEEGLRNTMSEWCKKKIFFIGYIVKCTSCSSKFWYSISEVSDHINCKGCQESNLLPAETPFSYKLNELVKNNICRVDMNGKIQPDGNLTVIRTLLTLNRRSYMSFSFSPQIDLYSSLTPATNPISDLDIVCEMDGKLFLGEAKHSVSGFAEEKRKSLNSLIELAKAVIPETIIISCTDDSKEKLKTEKDYLVHHLSGLPVEVEAIKTYEPTYNFDSYRYFDR